VNITGNMILDALDFLKERVKALESQFGASLFRFADEEDKRDPRVILREFEELQGRIARLMEVQAAYNLRVEVTVLGQPMSLQRVLQMVSSANKVKSLWAQAAEQKQANQYHFMNPLARDKEHEYAKPVVPVSEARELADRATRTALAFKQAIRSGNAREVEMDVTPDLFDLPA
jgi:hypothetical protein